MTAIQIEIAIQDAKNMMTRSTEQFNAGKIPLEDYFEMVSDASDAIADFQSLLTA